MSTHTAIATTSKGQFDAIQAPTETPGDGEVLIKVAYAAVILFDLYVVDRAFFVQNYPWTLGFNAAGTVECVGKNVNDLKVGDRVTALGIGESKYRSLQEYCIQPRRVVAKIPDSFSLEKAATIPDNFVTIFYALFNQLGLPVPSKFPDIEPPLATTPILIYGAGATTGQYAVQLLHLAGYKNIIATASQTHHEFLRSLGATHVFDYHSPTLLDDVAKAAGGDGKIPLALNCVSAASGFEILFKAMRQPSKLGVLVSEVPMDKTTIPEGVEIVRVEAHKYYQDEYIRDNLMPKILPDLLEHGNIQGNKVLLLEEGSLKERVGVALDMHRQNKADGKKIVIKID